MREPGATSECPRCGHVNESETRFCNTCGLQIDGLCPNCGAHNATATHFCGDCGYDFVLGKLPSAPAASFAAGDLREQRAVPAALDCPRCHHLNDPGAAFCYNCGLPFDGATRIAGSRLGQRIPAFAQARPGGFWIRVVAFVIDNVVVTAAQSFLILLFTDISPGDYFFGEEFFVDPAADVINWTIGILYAPVLLGIWSTTVGKRALGMYVVQTDGSRIGFWRALGRELAKLLSTILLGAGFWMVAFREDKRSLHDLIAGTVVVKR